MKRPRRVSGLYLVVQPILPIEDLLRATEQALEGGVDLLQLSAGQQTPDSHGLAEELAGLAKKQEVPFLVNNDLELALAVAADGVHFDGFNVFPSGARRVLGDECIVGYTVNMDLEKVMWAEKAGADYVSFCSVFASCGSSQCPPVPLEAIRKAKSTAKLPIFAAGGITLDNASFILETGVDGLAVTSALLKAKDPKQAAAAFKMILQKLPSLR